MQITSVRGAVVAVAAGAAVLGAPAVASATGIPLEPAVQEQVAPAPQQAGPVLALWDPQTGSSSLSSNVNARGLCLVQSVSADLDCFHGAQ